jgi:hypothetical protein
MGSFIYDILDYSGKEPLGFLEYISVMLPLALRILRRWLKTFLLGRNSCNRERTSASDGRNTSLFFFVK